MTRDRKSKPGESQSPAARTVSRQNLTQGELRRQGPTHEPPRAGTGGWSPLPGVHPHSSLHSPGLRDKGDCVRPQGAHGRAGGMAIKPRSIITTEQPGVLGGVPPGGVSTVLGVTEGGLWEPEEQSPGPPFSRASSAAWGVVVQCCIGGGVAFRCVLCPPPGLPGAAPGRGGSRSQVSPSLQPRRPQVGGKLAAPALSPASASPAPELPHF